MSGIMAWTSYSDPRPNPRLARAVLAASVASVFLLLAVPVIMLAGPLDRAGFDQLNFHEPAIRIFAYDWGHRAAGMNFKSYLSATTPGYHVALAFVARFLADSTHGLQIAGSLFTAGLLALLTYFNSAWAKMRIVLATSLCVLTSKYVFFPGVWLLPDNAGWLLVLAVLALAYAHRTDLRALVLGGILLVLTILTRQTHAWTAGVLLISFLWPKRADFRSPTSLATIPHEPPALAPRLLWGVAACVPAFLVLRIFYDLWQGLTPPLFQYQYSNAGKGLEKLNFAAPAFLLAILGLYAPFFALSWLPGLVRLLRSHIVVAFVFLAVAMLLVCIPDTRYSADQSLGRWEGLWAIAGKLPVIANHTSALIFALAVVGASALLGFFARLPLRDAAITLAALAGFAATQAVAFQLWQRYHEPLVLMVLAILACRPSDAERKGENGDRDGSMARRAEKLAYVGPLALAMVLAAMTVTKLSHSKPDHKLTPDELMTKLFPSAPKSLTPRMEP